MGRKGREPTAAQLEGGKGRKMCKDCVGRVADQLEGGGGRAISWLITRMESLWECNIL